MIAEMIYQPDTLWYFGQRPKIRKDNLVGATYSDLYVKENIKEKEEEDESLTMMGV